MSNKRLPDNVHLLKGTHRKGRHGDPEKKPTVVQTISETPPLWLTKEAKTEWRRIIKVMLNSNVLTNADTSTLSQYCTLFGELQKQKEDFPAAKHTQLRLCAVELGLTPSARSKIVIPNGSEQEDDF
ncbi:MAG: P27 family phage terminase small subunit [Anaerolineae bacterium]|nr:P27 family phage terminase small subunit [Anaerolineae bacterium]